jgi:hypothetical protein
VIAIWGGLIIGVAEVDISKISTLFELLEIKRECGEE